MIEGGAVLVGTVEAGYAGGVLYFASQNPLPSGKPLTPDEQRHIRRIQDVPRWLQDHPDLANDARIVNAGGQLPKSYDHVKEARDIVSRLQNSVRHLEQCAGREHRKHKAKLIKPLRKHDTICNY